MATDPSRVLPGLGIRAFWPEGTDHWGDDNDQNMLKLSVLVQGAVDETVAALPSSPAAGHRVILTTDNSVQVYDDGAWVSWAPADGWRLWDIGAQVVRKYSATAGWTEVTSALPTPAGTADKGKVVTVAADGASYELDTPSSGGGTTLPSLTGNAGKVLTVKSDESGTEWDAAGSSTGKTVYRHIPIAQLNTQSSPSFGSGYYGGRFITVGEDITVTAICIDVVTANGATVLTPFIYTVDQNAKVGALLGTGPTITGVTKGRNELLLTTPVALTAGTRINFGFICQGSSFYSANTAGLDASYLAVTGNVPANPGPVFTLATEVWASMYLKGTA